MKRKKKKSPRDERWKKGPPRIARASSIDPLADTPFAGIILNDELQPLHRPLEVDVPHGLHGPDVTLWNLSAKHSNSIRVLINGTYRSGTAQFGIIPMPPNTGCQVPTRNRMWRSKPILQQLPALHSLDMGILIQLSQMLPIRIKRKLWTENNYVKFRSGEYIILPLWQLLQSDEDFIPIERFVVRFDGVLAGFGVHDGQSFRKKLMRTSEGGKIEKVLLVSVWRSNQ